MRVTRRRQSEPVKEPLRRGRSGTAGRAPPAGFFVRAGRGRSVCLLRASLIAVVTARAILINFFAVAIFGGMIFGGPNHRQE